MCVSYNYPRLAKMNKNVDLSDVCEKLFFVTSIRVSPNDSDFFGNTKYYIIKNKRGHYFRRLDFSLSTRFSTFAAFSLWPLLTYTENSKFKNHKKFTRSLQILIFEAQHKLCYAYIRQYSHIILFKYLSQIQHQLHGIPSRACR